MNRKELIKAASQKCGKKHYWLKATNDSLQAYLDGKAGCPCCALDAGQSEQKGGENMDLADVIAQAIQGKVVAGIDRQEVESIVERMLDAKIKDLPTRKLEVVTENRRVVLEGRQHAIFEEVLTTLAEGLHVYLVGPAGSGKTTLAEQCAQALSLPFFAKSVGPQTSQSEIFGYMGASGNYVSTCFREAYEKGGLFLIDEIDAGNAQVLTSINAATSNGVCAFPDGMAKKHDNFKCIAAGNTYGRGQDRVYIGRNALDGATLDRFVFLTMDYDEALERDIALSVNPESAAWCDRVVALRRKAESLKARIVISPRATVAGAKLLRTGKFKQEQIENMVIFKGHPVDLVNELKG